jgi:hypothetical protein
VLDSDGNKAILLSGDWVARLVSLDERKVIKDVARELPRQWRDKLEREGGANGHAIPGPFQALLRKMDIGNSSGAYSGDNALSTFDQSGPSLEVDRVQGDEVNSFGHSRQIVTRWHVV